MQGRDGTDGLSQGASKVPPKSVNGKGQNQTGGDAMPTVKKVAGGAVTNHDY